MRILRNNSRRGIALIMVLLIMTVLVTLALGFAYVMSVETKLARNATFDDEFFWVAWAGVEAARNELGVDLQGPEAQTDSLHDFWAGGSGVPGPAGETNAPLFPGHRIDTTPDKYATWTTIDLDRKFNINIAKDSPEILAQGLTLVGIDPSQHSTIIDSIQDWCDRDDDKHPSGAESDLYRSGQGPDPRPYFAKNGPIDDISELLLINGITREMFYGGGGFGNVGAQSQVSSARRSHFEEPIYSTGLRDLFTALSGRALNINTASLEALQVLPPIDQNVAQVIIEERAKRPLHNLGELAGIPGLPPPVLLQIGRFVAFRSVVFEITVEAHIGGSSRTYKAVVRRTSPRDIQTLSMYPAWDVSQAP
jgi:type II secretory pathway component PulK